MGENEDDEADEDANEEEADENEAAADDQDRVGVAAMSVVDEGRVDGGRASRATSVRMRRRSSANSVSDWTHKLNRRLGWVGRRGGKRGRGRGGDGGVVQQTGRQVERRMGGWGRVTLRSGSPFEDLDLHEAHVLRADIELRRERNKVLRKGAKGAREGS